MKCQALYFSEKKILHLNCTKSSIRPDLICYLNVCHSFVLILMFYLGFNIKFSVYGGVYLDFDEILLRPVENLRKYDYTQVSALILITLVIGHLNPFTPSGLFYLNSLDRSISYIRSVWLVFIITIIIIMFCRNF